MPSCTRASVSCPITPSHFFPISRLIVATPRMVSSSVHTSTRQPAAVRTWAAGSQRDRIALKTVSFYGTYNFLRQASLQWVKVCIAAQVACYVSTLSQRSPGRFFVTTTRFAPPSLCTCAAGCGLS